MPLQTASTGTMSSRLLLFEGSWRKYVPSRYDRDAEVLMPSFHPGNGLATEVSTIAGRTTATGKPAPIFAISDSPSPLGSDNVLGQPSSLARRVPASVR